MSGHYYGVGGGHDHDEHITMPEHNTPTGEQSYYDPPLSPQHSPPPHSRSPSYSQYAPGDFEAHQLHDYPPQAYSMPQWPEDDIYRLGTPASGVNVPYNYQPPPPPAPPKPYLEEDEEDPVPGYSSRYSPKQRYSTYDDDDRRPILQPQQSQASIGSRDVEDPGFVPPDPRRTSTSKWADLDDVRLASGNLVLNCPLPSALMDKIPRKAPLEFSCMRYSAATCDPSEFVQDRFALRQQLFGQPRQTELFIVVTMYSEDEILFANTMIGVFKNIEYMCTKAKESQWGENGWKKIVVCVVSDGRQKIDPKTRSLLAAMGCYQEGIAKLKVNDKPVQAHIYEHTTQVGIRRDGDKIKAVPGGLAVPVQMLFCLKENNQQKINSHRWFFQAFGPALEPNICVLIDAGTKPGDDSIYQLWKAFYLNPQCAGACGEIKAELTKGNWWKNPLVATQNFEYKMSNILDKPLESIFGFISVLPGAFSAYRYVALQNDASGTGPLEMYFKGEKMHAGTVRAGILEKNMYLAEDRILCFELVTKRKAHWTLQYVKSAHAETDVPDNVAELVKQRRRWLNGSFFAAIFALVNAKDIWRSDHSVLRKMVFLFEFLYQTISLLFSWFALANFFLVFRILTASLGEKEMHFDPGAILSVIFEWFYFGVLFTCFILALGNKPDGSKTMYKYMMVFWAIIMLYLMFAAVYITVKSIQKELADSNGFTAGSVFSNAIFRDLVVSLASTYVLYFVASFMYFEPWHMFTSFIQYIMLSPSYINVLNIYAFCNVHDISWGTKGATGQHSSAKDEVKGGRAGDGSSLKQNSKDRDENYAEELKNLEGLSVKKAKEVTEIQIKEEQDQKDSYFYADVRCWVVLAWCSTNFALAAVILNSGGLNRLVSKNPEEVQVTRSTIYMAVVLWSVAVLAFVRFVGATAFLVLRMFRGV